MEGRSWSPGPPGQREQTWQSEMRAQAEQGKLASSATARGPGQASPEESRAAQPEERQIRDSSCST